jgi:hypothetical protein
MKRINYFFGIFFITAILGLQAVENKNEIAVPQDKRTEAGQKTSEKSPSLSPENVVSLSILATVGLVLMWGVFWFAAVKAKENIHEILLSPSFFRTITVIGVIASTVVLGLADRIEGSITGAILSGIVGYVLGQISTPEKSHTGEKKKSDLDI